MRTLLASIAALGLFASPMIASAETTPTSSATKPVKHAKPAKPVKPASGRHVKPVKTPAKK